MTISAGEPQGSVPAGRRAFILIRPRDLVRPQRTNPPSGFPAKPHSRRDETPLKQIAG